MRSYFRSIAGDRAYNPARMETEKNHPGFIRTKTAAVVAVGVTGLVAAMTYRRVFFSSPHHYHTHWLVDWSFMLPRWTLLPLNLAFYVAMISICVGVFLGSQGKERTLVAGWCPGFLLSPIRMFFPLAVRAVDLLDAVGITVAFVSAVLILRDFPSAPTSADLPNVAKSSDQDNSRTQG